jgi:sulfite exporter TauE/SafE
MIELAGAALVAGLMGSPHCVGMCGGFAGACSATRGGAAAWSLGRLLTYGALGAAGGAAGGLIPGPPWLASAVAAVLLVVFALHLGGFAPAPSLKLPWLSKKAADLLRRGGPFAGFGFGALTGLLPCGLLYTALALPVAAGGPLEGAAVMGAFWLGTVPALSFASFSLRRLAAARPWTRRLVAAGVLAFGLGALSMRTPAPDAAPGDPPPCHANPNGS